MMGQMIIYYLVFISIISAVVIFKECRKNVADMDMVVLIAGLIGFVISAGILAGLLISTGIPNEGPILE